MTTTYNSEHQTTKDTSSENYDPKDFKIEPVNEHHYDLYYSFMMKYFLPHAQLSKGLGVSPEESGQFLKQEIRSWMASGASVCAIHTPTNELAGLMLTKILTRNQSRVYEVEDLKHCSQNFQNLAKILAHLELSVNLFEDKSVDKILEIAATAVQSKFSGNKLTYRLTEESERLAIGIGCQMATSQSTNIITQHIRTKMGYEVCFILDYAHFELDGKKLIDVSLMNGSTVAMVFKKYLGKP